VSGVTVSGNFTGDTGGPASAITNSAGQVTLQSPLVKDGANWTFCVTNATGGGHDYNPGANAEDCDSTGATATFGSVSGQVTDGATSLGLAGAGVSTDSGQNAITDNGGFYTIGQVPTGARTVTATASGYLPMQKQAQVTEGATSTADFALVAETSGSGAIRGTVTDSGGAKIEGVLVMTDTGHSAVTNKGGKYSIQSVPAGNRVVTASKIGYATQQKAALVAAGQNTTVDFTL